MARNPLCKARFHFSGFARSVSALLRPAITSGYICHPGIIPLTFQALPTPQKNAVGGVGKLRES